jgi:hypothetical protein
MRDRGWKMTIDEKCRRWFDLYAESYGQRWHDEVITRLESKYRANGKPTKYILHGGLFEFDNGVKIQADRMISGLITKAEAAGDNTIEATIRLLTENEISTDARPSFGCKDDGYARIVTFYYEDGKWKASDPLAAPPVLEDITDYGDT